MGGWIGVDLDGTIAQYRGWNIGEPVSMMVARVMRWLSQGKDVRIMTARVSMKGGYSDEFQRHADEAFVLEQRVLIENWCLVHLGKRLPITCEKDFEMLELWDDRAIQLIPNTGIRADGQP